MENLDALKNQPVRGGCSDKLSQPSIEVDTKKIDLVSYSARAGVLVNGIEVDTIWKPMIQKRLDLKKKKKKKKKS